MNSARVPRSKLPEAIAPADEQHEAETDVGRAPTERVDALLQHAIAHRRAAAAAVDQHTEAGEHRLAGIVHLHRGGRRHHVAQQAGHLFGGDTVGSRGSSLMRVSSTRVATPTPSNGMIRISSAAASAVPERETGDHREDETAGHVDHAVDEVGDVFGVIVEVGDRRAGRTDGLTRVKTAAGHLALSMFARSSVCMWIDVLVQMSVPWWTATMRIVSLTAIAPAHQSVSSVLPASSELYPRPRKYPVTAGIMKKITNSDQPHQNSRG